MAASKGLGRAVATELAREGASVVITSRDEESLAWTAAEIADKMGAEVEIGSLEPPRTHERRNSENSPYMTSVHKGWERLLFPVQSRGC